LHHRQDVLQVEPALAISGRRHILKPNRHAPVAGADAHPALDAPPKWARFGQRVCHKLSRVLGWPLRFQAHVDIEEVWRAHGPSLSETAGPSKRTGEGG